MPQPGAYLGLSVDGFGSGFAAGAGALAGAPGRGEGFILGDVGSAVWVQVCKK